jgi:putative Mn2+ efflux pump MntP
MDKRDQELLAKQFRFVGNPPQDQNSATIGLITVVVFLVGIGIGDILSKSKQANTNYAAMVSGIAEAPPHSF